MRKYIYNNQTRMPIKDLQERDLIFIGIGVGEESVKTPPIGIYVVFIPKQPPCLEK